MSLKQAALDYHTQGRPGKIEVVATKPMATASELSLAYSPGVAEPCLAIAETPDDVFKYTVRGNLVAVVTNGTAVLGLGNIGPLASKPVMEGKGVLFKRFAGIDVFDLEVDSEKAEDVIKFCELLEPTVGGINLEDIASPECFIIERHLKESMDIPVFHDDQHGTAIISGAAMVNAMEVVGKTIDEARFVFSGAGASALSTATHLIRLGATPTNLIICDSKGVIYEGREAGMNEYKAPFAVKTELRTLEEAMVGADAFVGLSVKGIATKEMVASMADRPIIFALANPDPEILPEEVAEVRDDAIMATGRSDYPNQVNNVLGFPFIFRGALDVRSRAVNPEMMLAATHALAELAREEVPESVRMAYEGEEFEFGAEYLIPKPFDPRVLLWVSPAVAQAAMDTGVARKTLDMDRYRDRLRASLGPGRQVMRRMFNRARKDVKRVVLADGYSSRTIRAAQHLVDEGIAIPVLIGRPKKVDRIADELGVELRGVEYAYPPGDEAARYRYADILFNRRMRKGLTQNEARAKMYEPIYFASMMVATGEADALVAGIDSHYPEAVRPTLQCIGTAEGVKRTCGIHMVALPNRELMFFADTTMNIEPNAEELAEIALLVADYVKTLRIEPRIAMVSFSNFGSVVHPNTQKVRAAVRMVKERRPELEIDGEMQPDVAVNEGLLRDVYPFSDLTGPANVLVFPELTSANTAYKLILEIGGAEVIGPILMGMSKPVHILQRGSTVQDVINLATLAAVDAQSR
jgi:malate dehydrogenase (oxaloacetate-decarboxylating)(NADP+)